MLLVAQIYAMGKFIVSQPFTWAKMEAETAGKANDAAGIHVSISLMISSVSEVHAWKRLTHVSERCTVSGLS